MRKHKIKPASFEAWAINEMKRTGIKDLKELRKRYNEGFELNPASVSVANQSQ